MVYSDGTKAEIVSDHRCKQGISYAKNEALDPRRMLTSSILVHNGEWPLVSVKTTEPVPKDKIFTVLKQIKKTVVNAPIQTGDVLIPKVSDLPIDIVATKTILLKK
jgi:CxxC motif-containing protein